ncbi:hypothetical protein KFL_000210210 [Klebsormidium nitens]|uniref:Uncharacterized protein n=1 Tax=Klebsormidium nitens TaxID=105231 RepID=A0A1Y1HK42_KLENI|nr:hypothetical protein KFL_000210210 [Klebsormidium nitens]|eukprot:GAQ78935.1 hypothetical protein KFL_000210210 [Klebsormidium nitens]
MMHDGSRLQDLIRGPHSGIQGSRRVRRTASATAWIDSGAAELVNAQCRPNRKHGSPPFVPRALCGRSSGNSCPERRRCVAPARRRLQQRASFESDTISLSIAGVPSQTQAVNVGYQTTLTFTVTNTDSQAAVVDKLISISATSAGFSWSLSQFVSTVPFFFARNGPGSVTVSLAQFPPGASAQFSLVLTAFRVNLSSDLAFISGADVQIFLPQVKAADQGVCGSGPATDFPLRCYYNNDPQGRYVCCDNEGCAGFNPPQNFVPRCANNGFVPTLTQPPTPTPTATQPPPATPSPTPASTQSRATPSPTRPTTINFPKDTPCPVVGGFAANSCFDAAGTFHACCENPDSCGAFKANGDPTCAAGNYLSLP